MQKRYTFIVFIERPQTCARILSVIRLLRLIPINTIITCFYIIAALLQTPQLPQPLHVEVSSLLLLMLLLVLLY